MKKKVRNSKLRHLEFYWNFLHRLNAIEVLDNDEYVEGYNKENIS
ncbi:hypothetical protein [Bacillus sp. SM2101]|nr:hypothetical protein [Bacillus sp. SM2101]